MTVSETAGRVSSARAAGWRLAAILWTVNMTTIKMTYIQTPARNLVTSLTSGSAPRDAVAALVRLGNRAIKRAAIVPCSRFGGTPSGSAAIDEANLRAAVSRGNWANSAASCQG